MPILRKTSKSTMTNNKLTSAILKVLLLLITSLSMLLNINKSHKLANIAEVPLASIESLAKPENGGQSWLQPRTVGCKLELGGGWFTASVRRDCEFCAVPYSCTTVECGGSF
ncbi:MAG: hypothetical protein RR744_10905 [Cellulosilyticaceae bacterium]